MLNGCVYFAICDPINPKYLTYIKWIVMARIFSIDVPFQNKHYTALVSIKDQGSDIYCSVRYIDKGIKHILSGDQLVFSLQEGLKQPKSLPSELAESLFLCTTNALNNHLTNRA